MNLLYPCSEKHIMENGIPSCWHTWHLTSISKKSSSGSALSGLAIRWLSTAWLLFWLSLRPGRLPPVAEDSSNRLPWACETFADSETAAFQDNRAQWVSVWKWNNIVGISRNVVWTHISWWFWEVSQDHCLMITCCLCPVLNNAGHPCGCSGNGSEGQRTPHLQACQGWVADKGKT